MQGEARDSDALVARVSADVARIQIRMVRAQTAARLEAARIDPAQYQQYLRAVRDFDLDAAKWQRERERQRAAGWKVWACRGTRGQG